MKRAMVGFFAILLATFIFVPTAVSAEGYKNAKAEAVEIKIGVVYMDVVLSKHPLVSHLNKELEYFNKRYMEIHNSAIVKENKSVGESDLSKLQKEAEALETRREEIKLRVKSDIDSAETTHSSGGEFAVILYLRGNSQKHINEQPEPGYSKYIAYMKEGVVIVDLTEDFVRQVSENYPKK